MDDLSFDSYEEDDMLEMLTNDGFLSVIDADEEEDERALSPSMCGSSLLTPPPSHLSAPESPPTTHPTSKRITGPRDSAAGPSNSAGVPLPPTTQTNKNPRSVYLITYSRADVMLAGDRQSFVNKIIAEFGEEFVEKWCCGVELHKVEGIHYHVSIKLTKNMRWAMIAQRLREKYKINCNFRDWRTGYQTAYKYVTKYDQHALISSGETHEGLNEPPRTANATAGRIKRPRDSAAGPPDSAGVPKKVQKLKLPDVGNMIVANGLKTVLQVQGFANKQALAGKPELKAFLQSHPNPKYIQDVLWTNWSIESSVDDMKRGERTRMEILRECLDEPCAKDPNTGHECRGSWLEAALQTLNNNNIEPYEFSDLIKDALRHGQGKGHNVMICGPTNCAKSFILLPLTKIYNCFRSPSTGSHNWVGAWEKEVIFFNDIRYGEDGEKSVLAWRMFLNLLEGIEVNMGRPSTFFATDYVWSVR